MIKQIPKNESFRNFVVKDNNKDTLQSKKKNFAFKEKKQNGFVEKNKGMFLKHNTKEKPFCSSKDQKSSGSFIPRTLKKETNSNLSKIQPLFIEYFFSLFFRDGKRETGKKIFFQGTNFLIDKFREQKQILLYEKQKKKFFFSSFQMASNNFSVGNQLEKKECSQFENILKKQMFFFKTMKKKAKNQWNMAAEKKERGLQVRYKIFLKNSKRILECTELLTKSVENLRPYLSVRKVRRRGRTYYLPYFLTVAWSRQIAMKWIREAAYRKRKTSQSSAKALGISFLEGLQNSGYGSQKKEELHKLAIGNRTYARFRWW